MKNILAELLTIGDEILYGQTLDTNSHWMSGELDKAGIKTIRKTTVSDNEPEILQAFKEAEERADVVLVTGGLGPTNDDLTKPCLAKYFDCEIAINEEALEEITTLFRNAGREMTELNRQQAALPICCEKITNKMGTAPGMWFERNETVFVSMPGVPHEMRNIMSEAVIPKLQQVFQTPNIYHQMIKTVGIGESWLADKIAPWERGLPRHIKLAYLPSLGEVKLRLTATGNDLATLEKEVEEQINSLKTIASEYIYGYGDEKLEEVVGELLKKQNKTIAIGESCTGGFVAHKITSVPGSSEYFQGGIIPYHNSMKVDFLGVKKETIDNFGAVSKETVIEMAELVREKFKSDIGLASTGIAGPGGGTPEKPVGTVWVAYADANGTEAKKLQLWKDRIVNIKTTSTALLNITRLRLIGND